MKILFINHAGVLGGATVSMIHILEAIKNRGDAIEVINIATPDFATEHLKKEGYSVKTVKTVMSHPYYNGGVTNVFSPSYMSSMIHVFKSRRVIEQYIKDSDCDVVMVNSITLYYVGEIAKKYSKETVCFQRETLPETKKSDNIRKKMSQWFDMIVFISKYDMNKFDDYPHVKKIVLYDKINLEQFSRTERNETTKSVLFLGGINGLKGTLLALKAIKHLDNAKLLIVSKTSFEEKTIGSFVSKLKSLLKVNYHKKCYKYIKKHNLFPLYEIIEPTVDVHKLYENCDVVLFAATKAHQTRLIYESCGAGRPIVIPNYSVTKEFLYENVFEYKDGDPKDCAKVIKRALGAEIDYEKAYRQCKENHSVSTLKEEINKILDEVKGI